MLLGILTCKEALARLDDYLDRELSPREQAQVERHLKICHECARRFAFERSLVEGLRGKLTRLDVPLPLRVKVQEALGRGNAAPPSGESGPLQRVDPPAPGASDR